MERPAQRHIHTGCTANSYAPPTTTVSNPSHVTIVALVFFIVRIIVFVAVQAVDVRHSIFYMVARTRRPNLSEKSNVRHELAFDMARGGPGDTIPGPC